VIGIVVLVFGVIALLAAAAISFGVTNFNHACAQNPLCTPQPDPSPSVTAVGIVLLLVGAIILGYGYTLRGGD